jgi:hypothetical protein
MPYTITIALGKMRLNKIKNTAFGGIVVAGGVIGVISAYLAMPLILTIVMMSASFIALLLIK